MHCAQSRRWVYLSLQMLESEHPRNAWVQKTSRIFLIDVYWQFVKPIVAAIARAQIIFHYICTQTCSIENNSNNLIRPQVPAQLSMQNYNISGTKRSYKKGKLMLHVARKWIHDSQAGTISHTKPACWGWSDKESTRLVLRYITGKINLMKHVTLSLEIMNLGF